tara:strand:+ start:227 stop:463 length:237 start_codon:yes stop_codon:yes gene_type:complete
MKSKENEPKREDQVERTDFGIWQFSLQTFRLFTVGCLIVAVTEAVRCVILPKEEIVLPLALCFGYCIAHVMWELKKTE